MAITDVCPCWEELNTRLEGFNSQLEISRAWDGAGEFYSVLSIPTTKVDPKSRRKPRPVMANFCPFCGKDLRRAEKAEAA